MKTKVLLFILMIMCFCTSCKDEDNSVKKQVNENETKSSIDEPEEVSEVESETRYEYWKDDDIVWLDDGWNQFDGSYEYGKVTYDGRFERLISLSIYDYEDKLFGVQVEEGSGKTAVELYENYIKPMNVKTEFYGMSDEAIMKALEIKMRAQIMVFLTEEQVRNIVPAGCPEDMMIKVRWAEDFREELESINNSENYSPTKVWEYPEYSHIIRPNCEYYTNYDIDNDGRGEEVVLYTIESELYYEFPITKIKIIEGEKILYETDTILEGAKNHSDTDITYYLVNKDGKNYLMKYEHSSLQGEEKWNCELISIDADGNAEVVETLKANLSSGAWFKNVDLEENKAFYDAMMKYYTDTKMTIVVSLSADYSKMIYTTKANHYTQEDRFIKEPLGEVLNEEVFESLGLEYKEGSFEENMNTYYEYIKSVS